MPNPNFRSKINIATKGEKTYSTNHLELFCAKKPLQKTLTIRDHFENRPSYLCKILTLGQKLEFQKTCQNPFSNHLEVFCQKTARKNTKYSRNETILKISKDGH